MINSRYVMQLFVYGESLKNSLVMIVVPDLEYIRKASLNPSFRQLASLSLDEIDESILNMVKLQRKPRVVPSNTVFSCSFQTSIKDAFLQDFIRIGRRAGLKSFELPKDVYLTLSPFTIDQGLLTPTLKTKVRGEIRKVLLDNNIRSLAASRNLQTVPKANCRNVPFH